MEFLFPLIVVALGGAIFFFRWRARQRRRLYGPANTDAGIGAVMMGMSSAIGDDPRSHASPADTTAATATGRLGDGYSGPSSDGGGSNASGSDGGGSSGNGGGGGD